MAKKAPKRFTLRAYQVGFGDCFLLTSHYEGEDRHVLIDFGSMALPKGVKDGYMTQVARRIQKDCGGKLHVVAASHRHWDHIAGFSQNGDGDGPGDILRACKPDLVIQPWTEDPRLGAKATKPYEALRGARGVAAALLDLQGAGAAIRKEAASLMRTASSLRLKRVAELALIQLQNGPAISNLAKLGKRRTYAWYGKRISLGKLLPGVKVRVLGPPTIEQTAKIKGKPKQKDEEFWHLAATVGGANGDHGSPLFRRRIDLAKKRPTPEVRWFLPRVREARTEALVELTRVLDTALNNTSLILLFEVGKGKLLFPGDAQIESWSYPLFEANDRNAVRAALAKTTLYKVGHHGSLNATPKTLWGLFERKGSKGKPGRLVTLLSTEKGHHGSEAKGTEVPRKKLLAALSAESDVYSTEGKPGKDLCVKVDGDLA